MAIDHKKENVRLTVHLLIVVLLWGLMFAPFSPVTGSFWYLMTASAILLSSLALTSGDVGHRFVDLFKKDPLRQLGLSVVIAAVLYGVFVLGDYVARLLFGFAAEGIDSIYSLRSQASPTMIAIVLICIIGPAEEIFWRGYIQQTLCKRFSRSGEETLRARLLAFVFATAIYTLIHIWSGNIMLILAAMVAGGLWGLLYALKPEWFPAILISHALWDACAFVFFPI